MYDIFIIFFFFFALGRNCFWIAYEALSLMNNVLNVDINYKKSWIHNLYIFYHSVLKGLIYIDIK